ncbi:hypothetical protein M569_07935 [Genlisea aurea]|uniref:Transmembrane protein n=1 Tax=Genlisea aurea TaxID=192259 RepID=S8CJK9_9LAMI|nr:hypothetical protein M569_07935 [Genlisea aurea]
MIRISFGLCKPSYYSVGFIFFCSLFGSSKDLFPFGNDDHHGGDGSSNSENVGSPQSSRSFAETQLEIFHVQHGLLVLHSFGVLMFLPSLVARFQRIGTGYSPPWFWDSALCTGIILHGGFCGSKLECGMPVFSLPWREVRLSFVYLVAGYFSYLSALELAPYRAFYAMAAIGIASFAFRIMEKVKTSTKRHRSRKQHHSHRH